MSFKCWCAATLYWTFNTIYCKHYGKYKYGNRGLSSKLYRQHKIEIKTFFVFICLLNKNMLATNQISATRVMKFCNFFGTEPCFVANPKCQKQITMCSRGRLPGLPGPCVRGILGGNPRFYKGSFSMELAALILDEANAILYQSDGDL